MRRSFFCAIITVIALAAAERPYAGKWKINPDKSDFTRTLLVFENLPSGEWKIENGAMSYRFKIDGSEYPDGFGGTVSWRSVDPETWESVWKVNGKIVSTDMFKLSAGGNALTTHTAGTKANGETTNDVVEHRRVSGGPGLVGSWRISAWKPSAPRIMEFVASGENGLAIKDTDPAMVCETKLDGGDYPCAGPMLPVGWTMATSSGSHGSLIIHTKKDGKPVGISSIIVSEDGKSLTETISPSGSNPYKMVFDRQ